MIDQKLALVPHQPGCYLMKDKNGIIIYVGKSKNLKNRLSSYFKSSHTGKTAMLVRDIVDFEYILTSSELEALLLEINLIKKHDPKYNILLRDDKTYPYIEITNEKVFRLLVVRNPNIKKSKNTKLFGPFPNVTAARKVVDMINRIYPLRKCHTYEKKECLYYHIHECLGYCTKQVDDETMKTMRNEIVSFLNGNHAILTNKLKNLMEESSSKLQFEKALEYKELLDYITVTLERQKVELDDNLDRDIIGYYTEKNYLSMQILFIRGGKLLDHSSALFPMIDTLEEEITTYISKFYDKHKMKPNEVLVPDIVNKNMLSEAFDLKFVTPIRGKKKQMLNLATENAKNYFNEQFTFMIQDEEKTMGAIKTLEKLLHIDTISRIELFDNSNLFGDFNVSGMVVFIDGKPAKNEYRKFKITKNINDDYGTMREVIYRRYFRVLKDHLAPPNLIIVDGGIGQLNATREVLSSLNLNIPTVGLKKNEKHNTSELVGLHPIQVIPVDKKSSLFLLLTKMQDEMHNFTINYHRQIRSKGALASILDNIEGIGETRKNKLLKKYKTISKMKEASIEELKEILPEEVSIHFKEILNSMK
ncbi:MAG: excinuclease ABC subunit UvrC [Erysipelotrichaceae bacterium]|nr:excinuclease ABC subunit UvrC [Erysipelotrichaceae bacterium]